MPVALRIPPSRYPAPSRPALSVVPSSSDPQLRSDAASVGSTGIQVTTEQYIHTNASRVDQNFLGFFLHKKEFPIVDISAKRIIQLAIH